MTKPNKSAWSARQSGLRSAGRISKKSDRFINLYEKSGLDKSLQFVRDYHASSKRESTKEEILHSIIDLANHVFDSGSATLQMIDEMRDTYLKLSGGRRYINIVDGEKLDKFQVIMKQMAGNVPEKITEGTSMAKKITKQQLRQIIREEINRNCSTSRQLSEAKITQAELDQILADHSLYLKTSGRRGKRADLSGADLRKANLQEAKLRDADLTGANLEEAKLYLADLRGANLQGAHLRRANLGRSNLGNADLREANLQDANLMRAHLRRADLEEADLEDADLRSADLHDADLIGAHLRGANLQEANLQGANLRHANLYGADLQDASLVRANLRGADLQESNLMGANLQESNFTEANLQGANIDGVKY